MKKTIYIFIAVICLLLIPVIIITPYCRFITKTLKISLWKTVLSLDSLKTLDNQTNILLLGIAGGNHDGPNLTDSIMVANYSFKTNQLTTISFPRDIWSDTLKDKINTAYAYGEAKQTGGGLKLAKAEIETAFGKPIQYAIVIDFERFKELIDFLGGIDVNIENSFTDKKFPIAGKENDSCGGNDPEYACRYETISFLKGWYHLDGTTALKFVRSRHAEGDEGSDFARTKRQQKVTEAIKSKVVYQIRNSDLNKIQAIYEELNKLIQRDVTNQQLAIIGKNIFLKKGFYQKEVVLSEDFFTVPPYDQYEGKYVLIPQSGNFDIIHQYINCNIEKLNNCESLKKKGKENQ